MQGLCQRGIASRLDGLRSPHPLRTSALGQDELSPGGAYAFSVTVKETS